MYISSFNTFIGRLWLGADENDLLRISFTPLDGIEQNLYVLEQAKQEIDEYMRGCRQQFKVPYRFEGRPFQKRVWNTLRYIPYGKVWTYHQLAEACGHPQANRAVGNANHYNPLPIILPCHRVISSCGTMGGYAGGIEIKKKLLNLETINSL